MKYITKSPYNSDSGDTEFILVHWVESDDGNISGGMEFILIPKNLIHTDFVFVLNRSDNVIL